jgi:hypothetical protein
MRLHAGAQCGRMTLEQGSDRFDEAVAG